MISKDIDLYEVIKKLKELEKLKKLLLNKEQETLFNFFPKPVITLEEEEELPKRELLKQMGSNNNKDKYKLLLLSQQVSSFKVVALVIKAVTRFKMNLKKNKFSHFRKLYDSYFKIIN